jgi:hypothetical protein
VSEGTRARLKLDAGTAEIWTHLAKGISKSAIAKLVECSPSKLCDWLAGDAYGHSTRNAGIRRNDKAC